MDHAALARPCYSDGSPTTWRRRSGASNRPCSSSARNLVSSDAMVQRIRSAIRQTPGIFDNLTVNLEAGIPGVSLKLGSEPPGDPMLGLSDWLDQDLYPVLFSLDEAHEADPIVLGRLLNAVQLAGQHRPVGAILAGTPGLLETLRRQPCSSGAGARSWRSACCRSAKPTPFWPAPPRCRPGSRCRHNLRTRTSGGRLSVFPSALWCSRLGCHESNRRS